MEPISTTTWILAFTAVLFLGLWLHTLTGVQRLRGVIRAGLRKAERDNCPTVRISYNQLAEEMGWEPEFKSYKFNRMPGRKVGTTQVRASYYPFREDIR
jgi:hypothetical protein